MNPPAASSSQARTNFPCYTNFAFSPYYREIRKVEHLAPLIFWISPFKNFLNNHGKAALKEVEWEKDKKNQKYIQFLNKKPRYNNKTVQTK